VSTGPAIKKTNKIWASEKTNLLCGDFRADLKNSTVPYFQILKASFPSNVHILQNNRLERI
jgi:hypothetical protein